MELPYDPAIPLLGIYLKKPETFFYSYPLRFVSFTCTLPPAPGFSSLRTLPALPATETCAMKAGSNLPVHVWTLSLWDMSQLRVTWSQAVSPGDNFYYYFEIFCELCLLTTPLEVGVFRRSHLSSDPWTLSGSLNLSFPIGKMPSSLSCGEKLMQWIIITAITMLLWGYTCINNHDIMLSFIIIISVA